MAYATSDSSGTGASSSSGRSSPDELHALRSDAQYASHAFSPFGTSFPPRRSSTPASAFLPPRLWQTATSQQHQHSTAALATAPEAHTLLKSGNKLQQVHSHTGGGGGGGGGVGAATDAHANGQGAFVSLPRRTSFGTVFNNNRLAAFTALGIGPHTAYLNNSNNTSHSRTATPVAGDALTTTTSTTSTPTLQKQSSYSQLGSHDKALSSADTTPAPSMPSSPVQRPQKTRTVFLPGPDGICVESRSRRRSDAAR